MASVAEMTAGQWCWPSRGSPQAPYAHAEVQSSPTPLSLYRNRGDLEQGIRSKSQSKGLGVARGACDMGGPRRPLAGCDPAQRNPINTKSKMLPVELL